MVEVLLEMVEGVDAGSDERMENVADLRALGGEPRTGQALAIAQPVGGEVPAKHQLQVREAGEAHALGEADDCRRLHPRPPRERRHRVQRHLVGMVERELGDPPQDRREGIVAGEDRGPQLVVARRRAGLGHPGSGGDGEAGLQRQPG